MLSELVNLSNTRKWLLYLCAYACDTALTEIQRMNWLTMRHIALSNQNHDLNWYCDGKNQICHFSDTFFSTQFYYYQLKKKIHIFESCVYISVVEQMSLYRKSEFLWIIKDLFMGWLYFAVPISTTFTSLLALHFQSVHTNHVFVSITDRLEENECSKCHQFDCWLVKFMYWR